MTRQMKCIVLAVLAAFAQPVLAQSVSRTDTQTYEDNLGAWVIGQPKTSTNVNTGFVESETVYDATTALPIRTYKFGKLQQTFTYYGNGTMQSSSSARDNGGYNTTVAYSSWKRGIPGRIDFPDGTYITADIDNYGLIQAVEDQNRYETCYDFDPMGRLKAIFHPSEAVGNRCDTTGASWFATARTFAPVASSEYGLAAGHWVETVRTASAYKYTYYDAMWRPVLTRTYDSGNVSGTLTQTVTRYDANNQPVFQSYPTRAAISDFTQTLTGTRTTYDAIGRPTRVEQDSELGVLATTNAYLTNYTTQTTNPRGNVTVTQYRTYDQPNTEWPISIAHPGGVNTDITRNTFGLPTSIKRSDATVSATRTYDYFPTMELCRVVEPETGATLMGYDPAGNLAWSASGLLPGSVCDVEGDTAAIEARRVDRGYDQLDRITSLAFPDARGDTTYTYTPDGLQAQLSVTNFTNNLVKTTYAYNTRRLLAQETMQWDLITWPVTYGYDKYGHVLQQTYPGPLTVNYAPNALGQATQAGTYATGVTYFPNGAIASFDYGNGITHTLTQNARQLPMRSKDAFGDSTTYLDDSYDYDQNGNVLAISDGLSGARGNRDMTYDNLDRLTSVKSLMYSSTATAGTIYIGYDALDNITTVSAWNRSQRYCYDTAKNQLTFIRTPANSTCPNGGAATTALSYDVQGNVSSKNNNVYAFDFGNRLRSATDGTTTTTYVYDALGRRVRDITGSSRYSLYTQAGQIAYTSDARKNEATNYIYLGGSLVATSRLPTGSSTPIVEYQHTDALGTPVVVTNASRGIVERSEYEPYGTVLNRPKHDGPGFTGHVEDAATGLTYMQQRYYDPAVGRFLSVDPVTAYSNPVGAFNRYWYANNNPYRFKDPDGRKCATTDGKDSCTFDEFTNRKGEKITRDAALGGKISQLFGRGSRILRAEAGMTAKYTAAKGLAAKGGEVTIKGNSALGIPDQKASGSAIVSRMETIKTIANAGPSNDSTSRYIVRGGVPKTDDGSPSNGPMNFWSDGNGVDVGRMFGHEILHTIYSGVGLQNRGWANPDFNEQHQVPFDEGSDAIQ